MLGSSSVRPYRRRHRSDWVKDKAKEQEKKRRMSLRKYAETLPTHGPIQRKSIKKGMSMAKRPSSSPRSPKKRQVLLEVVEVVDGDNDGAEQETTGTASVQRTSMRLREKAAAKKQGLLTAIEKRIEEELEDYTSD